MFEVEVARNGLDLSVVASEVDSSLIPQVISRLADIAYGFVFWSAPNRTGYLASTVYKEVGETEAVVGVGASYAKFVVEGTAPHEIRPVNAHVLAFVNQYTNKLVFAPMVHHPGTKPNKFIEKAARDIEGAVDDVVAEEWRRVVV